MNRILAFLMISLIAGSSVFSQVSINTDGDSPDPSAMLDVKSTSKGVLFPRVSLTAANVAAPVSSPAVGLVVFNTNVAGTPPKNVLAGYYQWDGTKWMAVSPPAGLNVGDMQYWNGSQWITLPVGTNGQVLTLNNGIPAWVQSSSAVPQLPSLITNEAALITAVSAISGGNVSDGGAPVTIKGVCWSSSPNPTIADSKTNDAAGAGLFQSILTPLTGGTTYFIRAYATNIVGTGYGNEVSFNTRDGVIQLTTMEASSITAESADCGGNITDDGGAWISVRGLCWSTTPNPSTADNVNSLLGTGTGEYFGWLSGLSANTRYYLKAYAINSTGTYYGNEINFTTRDGVISLTTLEPANILATSAISGGNITDDGGAWIGERGVCWSTMHDPTIADSKTTDGDGIGAYTSNMTGLSINTTYYLRSYATNGVGTSYGNEITFSTLDGIVSLTTGVPSSITGTTAISGGTIIDDGGAWISARGVCWGTSHNPTIADSKTSDGAGMGSYISLLTGMSINTTYYIRAYATNVAGTSYGNELSFSTASVYSIGDYYQGGIIFYLDDTGLHGLISATSDQTVAFWGCYGNSIPGTSQDIGKGQANTTAIIHECSETGIAARICDDLVLNGYDDWFLPSSGELDQMRLNENIIGGFIGGNYCSSTEAVDENTMWYWPVNYGGMSIGYKNYEISVRAIRAFGRLVYLPAVTTNSISNITETTALCGGNITSDGGEAVTGRGVCWSTSQDPTISDNHTIDGAGTGIFESTLTNLTPNTLYYIRSYATNSVGTSYGNQLNFTTLFNCGSMSINHVAGAVSPVTKAVTYNTVLNIPGEPSKCWITSNLGADQQATSVDDATEASAGWYWQFNRMQGYHHDGVGRTPNTIWMASIEEDSEWLAVYDPCVLELGSGWRIPTYTEWFNVDETGGWSDWTGPWNSGLKLHAAGSLLYNDGSLNTRGSFGKYWSSKQNSLTTGWRLYFESTQSLMNETGLKANGFTVRCIK